METKKYNCKVFHTVTMSLTYRNIEAESADEAIKKASDLAEQELMSSYKWESIESEHIEII